MSRHANVCAKYEIEHVEVEYAYNFTDFIQHLYEIGEDHIILYYPGEFYEYADEFELSRKGLTKLLESGKFDNRYEQLINDLLNFSDQRHNFIHIDMY